MTSALCPAGVRCGGPGDWGQCSSGPAQVPAPLASLPASGAGLSVSLKHFSDIFPVKYKLAVTWPGQLVPRNHLYIYIKLLI